jgi:hypothetical protein
MLSPQRMSVMRSTLHTTTRGTVMPKELWFELSEQKNIVALLDGFPENARLKVTH